MIEHLTMGRAWVLDTGTKGTGAEMVPLEKVLTKPASKPEPIFVPPKRTPRSAEEPEPRQPSKFKVVDVMTRRVLAEDASARATVDLLENVRSIVDVRIYIWDPKAENWRMLSYRDQKLLWGFRGRLPANERARAREARPEAQLALAVR
jgi:hypothetical protein